MPRSRRELGPWIDRYAFLYPRLVTVTAKPSCAAANAASTAATRDGVGNSQYRCGDEAKAGEVVDHSARFVAQRGVQRAANGETRGIRRRPRAAGIARGIAAGNLDRDLIIDIEHAHGLARRAMLLFDRGEGERRRKTQAVDERRAELDELVVVGRSLDRGPCAGIPPGGLRCRD